jgi:hypothetical protein
MLAFAPGFDRQLEILHKTDDLDLGSGLDFALDDVADWREWRWQLWRAAFGQPALQAGRHCDSISREGELTELKGGGPMEGEGQKVKREIENGAEKRRVHWLMQAALERVR